jgi:phosphoribosylamine--glycine ligase/phosphoribosylformylglycinamidine cyclo-ligase
MALNPAFAKASTTHKRTGPVFSSTSVGIPVFGPSKNAARMEGSKAFSKAFMQRHSIPTAKFRVFKADQVEEAISHVMTCGFKVVLKASGLAAGKGVLIPETTEEAIAGLREIMVDNVFGEAGNEVVIEELLEGPELSVLAFCDGYTTVPLPAAQDHKRIGEGDTGPNTGGMGAYAPAPIATPVLMDRILRESLQPTIDGMRKEGKNAFNNVPRAPPLKSDRLPIRWYPVHRFHGN